MPSCLFGEGEEMKRNCTIKHNFRDKEISSHLVLLELHYQEKTPVKMNTF